MSPRAYTKHQRACRSKRKYNRQAAEAIARRKNSQGHYLNAYKCPVCHGWHIGHPHGTTRVLMAFDRLEKQKRQAAKNQQGA